MSKSSNAGMPGGASELLRLVRACRTHAALALR
jgi:hypothetical protein